MKQPLEPDLQITSPQNARARHVQLLRDRRYRDESGMTVVEGARELERALDGTVHPAEIYFCPELPIADYEADLLARCRAAGAILLQCSLPVFRKLAYRENPRGWIAVLPQRRRQLADVTFRHVPLLAIAESLEKPGNLGAILRSADGAGLDAVIVCDRCTDLYNPNTVRASLGTVFTAQVAESTTDKCLGWLDEHGVAVAAATPEGNHLYSEVDFTQPLAFAFGSEEKGLSKRWRERADLRIRIPMLGQGDSLNVATTAGILFYEAVRQRESQRS